MITILIGGILLGLGLGIPLGCLLSSVWRGRRKREAVVVPMPIASEYKIYGGDLVDWSELPSIRR